MNKETKGQLIILPKAALLSCTASQDPEKHEQWKVSMEIDIAQCAMEKNRLPIDRKDWHGLNRRAMDRT